jgi:hypothetical protein
MNFFKFSLISILFINLSCNNIERLDTSKIKAKVEASKIKRITPAQLNMQVERWGGGMSKALTEVIEKEAKTASKSRLEELCQLKNIKLIDSLSEAYKVRIRLLGMPDANNKTLFAKEKEVLEAYMYNAENKLPMESNTQRIGDSLFVYTYPITNSKVISKLCFTDETYNFALWSIVFRKADIIRKTNIKDLK